MNNSFWQDYHLVFACVLDIQEEDYLIIPSKHHHAWRLSSNHQENKGLNSIALIVYRETE